MKYWIDFLKKQYKAIISAILNITVITLIMIYVPARSCGDVMLYGILCSLWPILTFSIIWREF